MDIVSILTYILTPIYVIVCIFLIAVVLLQQGKGADLAGAFGGMGSQTAFGARGATTILQRLTTWAFVAFTLLALGLTVIQAVGSSQTTSALDQVAEEASAVEEAAPVEEGSATEGAATEGETAAETDAAADGTEAGEGESAPADSESTPGEGEGAEAEKEAPTEAPE